MPKTASDLILEALAASPDPLAVHEFDIPGISENSIAARLRELHAEKLVLKRVRPGKAFKEWILTARAPVFQKPAAGQAAAQIG